MGIIDFLQDWNCKKDIAKCIKVCAPKPLSTVPPPRYADQFCQMLSERIKGDATEFKIEFGGKESQKDENDVLESIEIKLEEKKAVEAVQNAVSKETDGKSDAQDNLSSLSAEIYDMMKADFACLVAHKESLASLPKELNPSLIFHGGESEPTIDDWSSWIKNIPDSKQMYLESLKQLIQEKITVEQFKQRVDLESVPIGSVPK